MSGDRLIRILKVVAVVVVVVVVVGVGWRVYRGLRWAREQNLKAAELPTLEELLGPPIPDEENAALLYQQAFDAFDLSDEDKEALSGEADPQDPERRSYDLPKLGAIVAKNGRALELLRKAATMARCRFAVDYSDARNARVAHLGRLRQAAKLQAAKARVVASKGRMGEALDAVAVCFDFAEHGKGGVPGYLSHSLAEGVLRSAVGAAAEIVYRHDCARSVSAGLRRRLRETDLVASYVSALEGEPAWGLRVIEQSGDEDAVSRFLRRLDRAHYVAGIDAYLELAPLPYWQYRLRRGELAAHLRRIPQQAILCNLLLLCVARSTDRREQLRARTDECIVALDLKAYKHEHGQYPETLHDLPEAAEEGYAEDVFSGKPLKYRREGAGFLLYSFGKDLDDDEGAPLGREVSGKPEWDDGDLVWRCSK